MVFYFIMIDKCIQKMQSLGAIHYLHRAAYKVMPFPDLYYIIYSIYLRFFHHTRGKVFLKPNSIPPLSELCAKSLSEQMKTPQESETLFSSISRLSLEFLRPGLSKNSSETTLTKPASTTSTSINPFANTRLFSSDSTIVATRTIIDQLPSHLIRLIERNEPCSSCSRPCFPNSCIRSYDIETSKCFLRKYCSKDCVYSEQNKSTWSLDQTKTILNVSIPQIHLEEYF